MTISLSAFAGVGTQFFDDLGNVLSGGKVYTYDAGTTTPRATYTDITGSVPHSNPIILDSAGRVPSGGTIWVTDGLLYKFVVTTALDVGLDTYNNVSGISGSITGASSTRDLVMMLVSNMNKVTSGFVLPASDPDLTLSIPSGSAIVAGLLVVKSSPENIVLAPSTTNHIFLQAVMDAGFNLLSANFVANTSGTPPANSIKIGTAVTSGSAVTSTTNELENFTIDRINGFSTSVTPAVNAIPVHDIYGNIWLGRVVGIGTVPDENHDPTLSAVQEIGDWGAVQVRGDNAFDIMRNAKYVAGTYIRRNSSVSSLIHFDAPGNLTIFTGANGAIGSPITWVNRLNIPATVGQPLTYEGNNIRHNGNIFHGRINSNGTAARLPPGWSSARESVGVYTITHNLSVANFTVGLTLADASFGEVKTSSKTATLFYVQTANSGSTIAIDLAFNFNLILD